MAAESLSRLRRQATVKPASQSMTSGNDVTPRTLGADGWRVFPPAFGCMGVSGRHDPADETTETACAAAVAAGTRYRELPFACFVLSRRPTGSA